MLGIVSKFNKGEVKMDIRRGVLYSVFFHLFLILLFSIVTCDINVKPPEPLELGISMIAEAGVYEEAGISASAGTPKNNGGNIPVEMPETDAPPIKGEETKENKTEKLNEGMLDTLLSEGKTGKELVPKVSSIGEESLGVGGKKGMAFSITGKLSERKILKKVIPQYPKGYETRTKVEVRLTVNPNGEVKKLLLLKTGGAVFDNLTLEALRDWKWQPLPLNVEQADQKGIITFFYELM